MCRRMVALLVVLVTAGEAGAAPSRNEQEMRAREAFGAGRYQEALDLFVKLYAETLHPTYLRNIGRAYQNLDQPDKAITSFREYLRKARNLADGEREEIEGYIREMEALKRGQAAKPPAEPRMDLVQTAVPPPREEERPAIYRRWWFWTLLAAAAAGGTAALVAGGVVGGPKDAPCTGRICR